MIDQYGSVIVHSKHIDDRYGDPKIHNIVSIEFSTKDDGTMDHDYDACDDFNSDVY